MAETTILNGNLRTNTGKGFARASRRAGRIPAIIYGDKQVTTGASNDIERASEIARNMIKKWGLSSKLGPIMYGQNDEHPFLGHSMGRGAGPEFSAQTANDIDVEVRSVIDASYAKATKILKTKKDILHAMAKALMKYETLDAGQIKSIMDGNPVKPPEGWNDKDNKSAPKKNAEKTTKTTNTKPGTKPDGDSSSVKN